MASHRRRKRPMPDWMGVVYEGNNKQCINKPGTETLENQASKTLDNKHTADGSNEEKEQTISSSEPSGSTNDSNVRSYVDSSKRHGTSANSCAMKKSLLY